MKENKYTLELTKENNERLNEIDILKRKLTTAEQRLNGTIAKRPHIMYHADRCKYDNVHCSVENFLCPNCEKAHGL